MDYLQRLQERMEISYSILNRYSEHGFFIPGDLALMPPVSSDESLDRAIDDVNRWFRVTEAVIADERPEDDPDLREFRNRGEKAYNGCDLMSFLIRKLRSGQNLLDTIIEVERTRSTRNNNRSKELPKNKEPKVFISHKQEDKLYADALINLVNFIIGPDGDKIFCSSIPGYGIRQSRDIIDELKSQFEQYDIFMVFVHSPRYYESPICMNEMGASWVLGTRFCSFMTKDCSFEHMKGVINREKICINPNDDLGILNSHLNDFKNDLLEFFHSSRIDENKWEHARERFVKEISLL